MRANGCCSIDLEVPEDGAANNDDPMEVEEQGLQVDVPAHPQVRNLEINNLQGERSLPNVDLQKVIVEKDREIEYLSKKNFQLSGNITMSPDLDLLWLGSATRLQSARN